MPDNDTLSVTRWWLARLALKLVAIGVMLGWTGATLFWMGHHG